MELISISFYFLVIVSAVIILAGLIAIPFVANIENWASRKLVNMRIYRVSCRIIVLAGVILLIGIILILLSVSFPSVPDKVCISVVRVDEMSKAVAIYSASVDKLTDFKNSSLVSKLVPPGFDSVVYLDVKPARRFLFWKCYSEPLNEKGEFVDGWGHPLVIKLSPSGDAVRVYSVGENGIDENGKGDDIEASTVIPYQQKPKK